MRLKSDQLDQATNILAVARREGSLIKEIPAEIRPLSLKDAYAIQDGLAAQLGWSEGGWFCACVNTEIQQQLGLDEPYYGRAVIGHQFPSPARLQSGCYPPISLECEFAFRLSRDLPARPEPYQREEVAAAIASVHPVIEAVAGYLKDWINQDVFSVVADNGTDGPLIYGESTEDFPFATLDTVVVELHVNGKIERTGSGANVGGHPLDALTWLANARSRDGNGLKAGFLHNTGTATSLYWVKPGDKIVADFGPLGRVELGIA